MNKLMLVALLLSLQGCISLNRGARQRVPPPPPPAPVLLEEINDEQFIKLDTNKDGALDKFEIKKATTPTDEWGAIKIFLILIGAVALICVAPIIPSVAKKAFNKRKPSELEEK